MAMLAKSHGVDLIEDGFESPPIVKDSRKMCSLAKSKAQTRPLFFTSNNFESLLINVIFLKHDLFLISLLVCY